MIGCGGKGEGRGGEEDGLLNLHLIFQKTWAEPGNQKLVYIYVYIKLISVCKGLCMYVCLIITVKRLDQSVPNFAHRSTLDWLFDLFLVFGNFHLIFPKTWAEIVNNIICRYRRILKNVGNRFFY